MRLKHLLVGLLTFALPLAARAQAASSLLPAPVVTSPVSTIGPCTTSTVGTTPTLILDSVSAGTGRGAGGFAMPSTGTTVYYQWGSSVGLTTAQGGIVFVLYPGGVLPFAGAPTTQLWMISTAQVVGSCFYGK